MRSLTQRVNFRTLRSAPGKAPRWVARLDHHWVGGHRCPWAAAANQEVTAAGAKGS